LTKRSLTSMTYLVNICFSVIIQHILKLDEPYKSEVHLVSSRTTGQYIVNDYMTPISNSSRFPKHSRVFKCFHPDSAGVSGVSKAAGVIYPAYSSTILTNSCLVLSSGITTHSCTQQAKFQRIKAEKTTLSKWTPKQRRQRAWAEGQPADHSRPQSPSFLGHVVGKRGALEAAVTGCQKISDIRSRMCRSYKHHCSCS